MARKNSMSTDLVEKELGSTAWSQGNYSDAIDHFSKSIDNSTDKNFLKVLFSNRSDSHLKLKQTDQSLADANKCIELDANWSKGYSRKGDALYSQGKLTEAYNAYNAGLRADKNDKTLIAKAEQAMNAIAAADTSSSSSSSSFAWGNSQSQRTSASAATVSLPGTLGTIQTYRCCAVLLCHLFIFTDLYFTRIVFFQRCCC